MRDADQVFRAKSATELRAYRFTKCSKLRDVPAYSDLQRDTGLGNSRFCDTDGKF